MQINSTPSRRTRRRLTAVVVVLCALVLALELARHAAPWFFIAPSLGIACGAASLALTRPCAPCNCSGWPHQPSCPRSARYPEAGQQ